MHLKSNINNKKIRNISLKIFRFSQIKTFQAKIVKLVSEVDFAVERHSKLLAEAEEEKQKILNSKLKPKGELLLKQKQDSQFTYTIYIAYVENKSYSS